MSILIKESSTAFFLFWVNVWVWLRVSHTLLHKNLKLSRWFIFGIGNLISQFMTPLRFHNNLILNMDEHIFYIKWLTYLFLFTFSGIYGGKMISCPCGVYNNCVSLCSNLWCCWGEAGDRAGFPVYPRKISHRPISPGPGRLERLNAAFKGGSQQWYYTGPVWCE